MRALIVRFFQLESHGATLEREITGGITTFLAMSYIIFVQPGVLSQAGMDFRSVLAATCLAVKLATGRWRECPALTYVFAALFVVQFLIL
jgi:adenine/guanine/hypoxanthine permease